MTRIALLADAHANLPALQAVLADVQKHHVQEVWFLGDFIGYGPYPDEVIRLLRNHLTRAIVGNYDLNVLQLPKKKTVWRRKKDPSKYFSLQWTYRHISKAAKTYLDSLPKKRTVKVQELKFLLVHGSPRGIDDPLHKDTPASRFRELARGLKTEMVLCGHTHVYFKKKQGGITFINPGSIGRPFDRDPRASYALLTVHGSKVSVTNRRVRYDVQKLLRKMKREKFPEVLGASIASGTSVDQVQDQRNQEYVQMIVKPALSLAARCRYEKEHAHQVTRLSLELFDELASLHRLTARHRAYLQIGALLHDIGWIRGGQGHHKSSRDLILKDRTIPVSLAERTIIALIARYHRKALPQPKHQDFARLPRHDKEVVRILASILRIADGLDCTHRGVVKHLSCRITTGNIRIVIDGSNRLDAEQLTALNKGNLFREVFLHKLEIIKGGRWS